MSSALSRGLILMVLITCSMLLLWWFAPDAEQPQPTPSATLSATAAGD